MSESINSGLDALIAQTPTIKFRHHRGSLDESIATVVELPATKEALLAYLKDYWKDTYEITDIEWKHVCFDERIGWDTWIVGAIASGKNDPFAVGHTNGPLTYDVQIKLDKDQLLQIDLDLYLVRNDTAFEQLKSLFPNAVVWHKDITTTYPYVVKVTDVVFNKDRFITLTYTPALEWVAAYKNIIATVLQSTTSKEEEE